VAEVARERRELKDRHPGMRWREVYGFRSLTADACLDIDLERVCEIVTDHLPPLRTAVERELARSSRKRLRRTDRPSGGNSGGNEVGTNRVPSWLSVSARVPSEWLAVQRIPDKDQDCGPLGRPPTEPKVSGSNPDGRAARIALL
jgi:Protein of unknown function DUF86